MKFRFHRELLTESMETLIEVESMAALQAHIQATYEGHPDPIEIRFEHGQYDDRIGWDTWYVMGKMRDGREYPIGMSDAGSFD